MDLEHCLVNFEFSVVPRSLFTSDGEPIAFSDTFKILHHIEELGSLHKDQSDESTELNEYESSVLIIDGMTVLNQIHKDKVMETCKVGISSFWCNWLLVILKQSLKRTNEVLHFFEDLAAAFTRRVIKMASDYTEVRLVFDRYIIDLLKARTRRQRNPLQNFRFH